MVTSMSPFKRRGRYKRAFLCVAFLSTITLCGSLDVKSCETPLGMESGAIADSALTASSFYVANVGPERARLKTEKAGGGWCPHGQVEKGVKEYLEVNLGRVHVVTGISTQGRDDHGRGQEYTEEYYIEYWRPKLGAWKEYIRWDKKKIFTGNSDTVSIISHNFTPPIHASKLRIVPYSIHRRTVCMRIELYGCEDDSGVVSYTSPISIDTEEDLCDSTYDGIIEKRFLVQGLGRLTDGQVGGDYFTLDIGIGRGSGWVAWRNSTSFAKYVELTFEFDHIRNFSKIVIFTNNYYSRRVRMFRRSRLTFSIGGQYYNTPPLVTYHKQDHNTEQARNISIPLPGGRVGKFAKIKLAFAAEWIMLGEIYFHSDIIYYAIDPEKEQMKLHEPEDNGGDIMDTDEEDTSSSEKSNGVEVAIGALSAVVLVLILTFIAVLIFHSRQKYAADGSGSLLRNTFAMKINMKDLLLNLTPNGAPSVNANDTATAPQQGEARGPAAPGPSRTRITKHSYVTELSPDSPEGRAVVAIAEGDCGFVPNILPEAMQAHRAAFDARLNTLHHIYAPINETMPAIEPLVDHRGKKPNKTKLETSSAIEFYSEPAEVPYQVTYGATGARPKQKANTCVKNTHKNKDRQRQDSTKSVRSIHSLMEDPRAVVTVGDHVTDIPRYARVLPSRDSPGEESESDVVDIEPIDWGTWNILPSTTGEYEISKEEINPIPMYCLILHAHMGVSHSGEVSIYRTENIEAIVPNAPHHVAVRATRATQPKCVQEVRFLVTLRHEGLCKILGIATGASPPLTVIEHSEAGDLRQLLARAGSDRVIGLPLLIYICVQICSAMKYLESKNIVHRDLAARNCIVFPGNRVKVSDIASCSPLYKNDYCAVSGDRPIPVRWLSWESILLNRYTCSSTVWSYAVTVWEILNHCTQVPYDLLTVEQVVENAENLYYGGESKADILLRPDICPPQLYEVLLECWKRDETRRPSFQALYHFMITTFKQYVPMEYPI